MSREQQKEDKNVHNAGLAEVGNDTAVVPASTATARHTPGPWAVRGVESRHVVELKTGMVVAYCGTVYRSLDEINANAEFIVRACNSHDAMLAALKKAEELVHGEYCGTAHNPFCEELQRLIAKAEGRDL